MSNSVICKLNAMYNKEQLYNFALKHNLDVNRSMNKSELCQVMINYDANNGQVGGTTYMPPQYFGVGGSSQEGGTTYMPPQYFGVGGSGHQEGGTTYMPHQFFSPQ